MVFCAFPSLQRILLQSEEELLAQRSCKVTNEVPVVKPKKTVGRMKVQSEIVSLFVMHLSSLNFVQYCCLMVV